LAELSLAAALFRAVEYFHSQPDSGLAIAPAYNKAKFIQEKLHWWERMKI
jgi:hypothetical protein